MMWADLPVVVERRSGGRQEPIQVIHITQGRCFRSDRQGLFIQVRRQGLGQGSSEV